MRCEREVEHRRIGIGQRYCVGPELVSRPRAELPQVFDDDLEGLVRRVLIYLGPRKLRTENGIDIWPVAEWLEAVDNGSLWP